MAKLHPFQGWFNFLKGVFLFGSFFQSIAFAYGIGAERPNFLIIVVDDMGYGDLSKYEHSAKDAHTPNLNEIASRGTLYTQAYVSAAVCSPSRAGWITGLHQARWDPKSGFNCGLPKGIPTLASILRKNGYKTAKIGKNDFGNKTLHRQDIYALSLIHISEPTRPY